MRPKKSAALARARDAYSAGGTLAAAAAVAGLSRRTVAAASSREGWVAQRGKKRVDPVASPPPPVPIPPSPSQPRMAPTAENVAKARQGTAILLLGRFQALVADSNTPPSELAAVALGLQRLAAELPTAEMPAEEKYRTARAEREQSRVRRERGDLVEAQRVAAALRILRQAWEQAIEFLRAKAPELVEEIIRLGRAAGARVDAEMPEVARWSR